MRVVVFADVHGNVDAFSQLLMREKNADYFLCLGDLVGYAPFANDCLALLETVPHGYIRGNHEDMFIQGEPEERCSNLAKKFFHYAYKDFDMSFLPKLRALPTVMTYHGFTAQHTLLDRYIYPNTEPASLTAVVGSYFIGHSHCQFYLTIPQGRVINPGSLGQNRKTKGVASYLVWDPHTDSFSFENFMYDHDTFAKRLFEKGYPAELVEYYRPAI